MTGFSQDQHEQLIAAGWIVGTDCGYRNHRGYVRDIGDGRTAHYSLTPAKKGRFLRATIESGVCVDKHYETFGEVIARFTDAADTPA